MKQFVEVLQECREKYPEYEIFDDPDISNSAYEGRLKDTEESFLGIIQDVHMLSLTNHVVCTHSSNVSI